MPARRPRMHAAALTGYVSVAVAFAWPLPLQLGTALFGSPGGDTGVYVWNLWVFSHEVLSHGTFPFFTREILHATPAVPLTLHNYTTVANVAALPLLPLTGTVAAFNLLVLASGVLSAYVMFLFLRAEVRDPAAAWLGGLLFGFSPFMIARQMAHFSLVQAAPLPAFALLLHRLGAEGPTRRRAAALGAVLAWAFLSDPYYAVYCVLMGVFFVAWRALTVEWRGGPAAPRGLVRLIDVCLAGTAALIAFIIATDGAAVSIATFRISARGFYTPVLVFVVLSLLRGWTMSRPVVRCDSRRVVEWLPAGAVAGAACAALLLPVVATMIRHAGDGQWIAPPVFWRSSAPGVDLLAFGVPNPVGTFTGWATPAWLRARPDGLYENIASIPWTGALTVAAAVLVAGVRLPRFWVAFTGAAALLALGPFITVAGANTYVPTPWTLLRYLPGVGAARMPTRLTVLVMLGVAVLLAHAVRGWRARAGGRWGVPAVAGVLMVLELCPAPRALHDVHVPQFYRLIAEDPRPVSVMHLPFGLRDGLSSTGDFSAHAQFLQTFHEKPLMGGYLSRLPRGEVLRYRRIPLMDVLLELSEGREVPPDRARWALGQPYGDSPGLNIGYVVVDTSRASPELVAFAREALDLQHVATDGGQELYIVR